MNIVICGAGEVGSHCAEVLASQGHNITVIDQHTETLSALDDVLDVRNLMGNGAHADVLLEAGCAKADLVIAAMKSDEMNLLSGSIAKALGSLAIEQFARGQVEMQQFPVSDSAKAVGSELASLKLPASSRLAAIERNGKSFLPDAQTVITQGDIVTLIGESTGFDKARKLFDTETDRNRRVIILGGTSQCVWVCRALKDRGFSAPRSLLKNSSGSPSSTPTPSTPTPSKTSASSSPTPSWR